VTEKHPIASEDAISYLHSLPSVPLWEQSPAERREQMRRECLAGAGRPAQMASVIDVETFGVAARLYRPAGYENGVLLWMHGGAWMFGDLDCCDAVVRTMAIAGSCSVLSVDYRLVPEHRFPAALEDCWAALQWARQESDLLAVGGDSSGGNLAAATAILARDAAIDLRLQLLVYPVLDYRVDSPSYAEFGERYGEFAGIAGYGRSRVDVIRYIWEEYVPHAPQRTDERASPLRTRSFENLAPAFIVTAGHDILRGEGEDFASRLGAAGVTAELTNYDNEVHGFFPLVGTFPAARDAAARCGEALRRAFAPD
jgi:acetyl esterase